MADFDLFQEMLFHFRLAAINEKQAHIQKMELHPAAVAAHGRSTTSPLKSAGQGENVRQSHET